MNYVIKLTPIKWLTPYNFKGGFPTNPFEQALCQGWGVNIPFQQKENLKQNQAQWIVSEHTSYYTYHHARGGMCNIHFMHLNVISALKLVPQWIVVI